MIEPETPTDGVCSWQ